MERFAGKTAVITGASRGIGLAIAQRLQAEGARVCLTARKNDALQTAVADFPPGAAIGIAGRADDPVHRQDVLGEVAQRWGGLDILVNNAGINPVYGPLLDIEADGARKILEVNVLGTLGWTRDVVHHSGLLFDERRGVVVNIASVAGHAAAGGLGMYGASKAAVMHMTRTLAVELGPNIRVNAVAPAVVKTQFARALYEGREEAVAGAYPLARLGVPADIAAAVAFLASSDASWITGQVLDIDGGLLAAGGGV